MNKKRQSITLWFLAGTIVNLGICALLLIRENQKFSYLYNILEKYSSIEKVDQILQREYFDKMDLKTFVNNAKVILDSNKNLNEKDILKESELL